MKKPRKVGEIADYHKLLHDLDRALLHFSMEMDFRYIEKFCEEWMGRCPAARREEFAEELQTRLEQRGIDVSLVPLPAPTFRDMLSTEDIEFLAFLRITLD